MPYQGSSAWYTTTTAAAVQLDNPEQIVVAHLATTPRELRHSFVSLLSNAEVPIEQISQLVGHRGTTVTELVYRHQLKPIVQTGATVMDRLFGADRGRA